MASGKLGISMWLSELKSLLVQRDVKAYLVGGCVRDLVLGRPVKDLDVTVVGDSLSLSQEFAAQTGQVYFPLDVKRNIARIVLSEEETDLTIDVASMAGSNIRDDLGLRDFTINSLAVLVDDDLLESIFKGESSQKLMLLPRIIDPFGGIYDIDHCIIRATSDRIFENDPVRLLRSVRIASELGFLLECETKDLAYRCAPFIDKGSAERIRDELLKIVSLPGSADSLILLDKLDILCRIIPELSFGKGVGQPIEHYWDVFGHNVEAVRRVEWLTGQSLVNGIPYLDPVEQLLGNKGYFDEVLYDGFDRRTFLKIGALLHDIAKPHTKTVDLDGRVRFLGHNVHGSKLTREIMARLKVNKRAIGLVELMVQHHLRPSQMHQPGELPSSRAIYRYFRDVGNAAIDTLYLSLADYLAARGPNLDMQDWTEFADRVNFIMNIGIKQKSTVTSKKLINGNDLMRALSITPGSLIGVLLNRLHEAESIGEITTKEEGLALAKTLFNNHLTISEESRDLDYRTKMSDSRYFVDDEVSVEA